MASDMWTEEDEMGNLLALPCWCILFPLEVCCKSNFEMTEVSVLHKLLGKVASKLDHTSSV